MVYDDQGNFVGFCYTHQGRRVLVDGEDGCQHDICVKLRGLPDSTSPMFNIGWLKQTNELGQTTNEMEREIVETAKAEGREIQRRR